MREDDAFMWGTSGFYRYEHLPIDLQKAEL